MAYIRAAINARVHTTPKKRNFSQFLNVNHDVTLLPPPEGLFRVEREDPEGPERMTEDVVTETMLRSQCESA